MAYRFYTPLIHHREWARNGMVPHTQFPQRTLSALNHVYAFRRKTFFTFGRASGEISSSGSITFFRARCRTGYAATYISALLGATVQSSSTIPKVTVTVEEVGGSTQTQTFEPSPPRADGVYYRAPSMISYFRAAFPVSPDTEYNITIIGEQIAVIFSGCFYEVASNETLAYFSAESPGALHPITDALREDLLVGLSQAWKRNGSHLIAFSDYDTARPTVTGTTWQNIIDDSTAAVSASTPGFYLSDMEPWCRLSEPTTLRVVLAAYCKRTAGTGTGEVRIQDTTGTRCSLTGIGATEQWTTTTTSIASIGTMDKVDVQIRASDVSTTFEVQAVSLYCYVA